MPRFPFFPAALLAAIALASAPLTARSQNLDVKPPPLEPRGPVRTAPIQPAPQAAPVQPTPPAAAAQPPAPPVAPSVRAPAASTAPVVGSNERLVIAPARIGVGQRVSITLSNFPPPNADILVIVPAGTPDTDPQSGPAPLFRESLYSPRTAPIEAGPFAPGAYEARYFTTLYNNERRYEVSARTPFTVER